MVQDFHREYAKGVKQFCNSLPPSLGITAQMLDEYLRACAVYMWSFGSQPEKNLDLLNKMCTEKQVKVTLKELQKGIEEYQSEPDRLVEVPEFFKKLVEDDVAAGTSNSHGFADLQRKILTLCAAGSDSHSFDESRHLLLLHHQLNAVCSQEGVERIEAAAPVSGQDNAEILRSLMDQLGKSEEQDDQDVPAGSSRSSKAFNLANMQVKVSGTKPAFKKTPKGSASMPNLESAMADLDAMIGLQQVKDQVRTLVDLIHTRNLREKHGLTNPEMSYHLVFAGNPGTGKTTVARIMGRIYGALGILSQGHLVEVDRSGMVGRYVGETAQKTRDVIKQAMGGILFIDEAYALAPLKGDNDYGQEAVNTLIKAMEDNRTNFVVIAAGYTNEMERFLNSNPGLKSRFNEYILFEDYSADQLVEIFLRLLEQNDYYLDNADGQLEPAVRQYFIGLYQNSDRDQFGNAREARNIFEKIVRAHGGRVAHIENPTREDLMAITWDDLIGTMFEKPDSE